MSHREPNHGNQDAAKKTILYVLLVLCVGMAAALGYVFMGDATQSRDAREVERIQGAQERVQEVTPPVTQVAPAPPAPALAPR